MTIEPTEAFVSMPVPVRHVMRVYALLASLDNVPQERSTAGQSVPWPEESEDRPVIAWSVEDLRRFQHSGTKTSHTISALMDVLCRQPGAYFTTSEIVEATGISRDSLRGALSALTRHMHKHYGNRQNWPFAFKWGPSISENHPAEAHYVMADAEVEVWQASKS